ncbi:MAG: helix-turn-helix domain-containing protein [Acidobacteria bacterium]|nr:helix-turn-helix domain-containing protein [Acidobacteriota bacterium]
MATAVAGDRVSDPRGRRLSFMRARALPQPRGDIGQTQSPTCFAPETEVAQVNHSDAPRAAGVSSRSSTRLGHEAACFAGAMLAGLDDLLHVLTSLALAAVVHAAPQAQRGCGDRRVIRGVRTDTQMVRAERQAFEMGPHQRERLIRMMRAGSTPQRLAKRCAIAWHASHGLPERAIAETVGVARRTVVLWKARFRQGGVDALLVDRPGRGRKRRVAAEHGGE